MGECDHCGYRTGVDYIHSDDSEESMQLCVVCASAGLHLSGSSLSKCVGKLFNAMIDGHGVSYREAVEQALLGDGPAAGSYESY